MKKILIFMLLFIFLYNGKAQNVGIGTTTPGHKLTIEQPGGGKYNEGFEWTDSALALRSGTTIGIDYSLVLGVDTLHKVSYIQSYLQGYGGKNLVINGIGGNVGIGTSTPNAALDVSSTTQGFLPPRMTAAQRIVISSPAEGLLLYQTDGSKGYIYLTTLLLRLVERYRSITWLMN